MQVLPLSWPISNDVTHNASYVITTKAPLYYIITIFSSNLNLDLSLSLIMNYQPRYESDCSNSFVFIHPRDYMSFEVYYLVR